MCCDAVSVHLSVTPLYFVKMYCQTFSLSGSPTILVFPHDIWRNSHGSILTGAAYAGGA